MISKNCGTRNKTVHDRGKLRGGARDFNRKDGPTTRTAVKTINSMADPKMKEKRQLARPQLLAGRR
ncbi:hypothetical protein ACW18Q_03320 [Limosilactobacillus reuteri]